jgi:hypothetical protein
LSTKAPQVGFESGLQFKPKIGAPRRPDSLQWKTWQVFPSRHGALQLTMEVKLMAIKLNGKTYEVSSLGFILVFLVLVAAFVLWMLGKGSFELALIAAIALAILIG